MTSFPPPKRPFFTIGLLAIPLLLCILAMDRYFPTLKPASGLEFILAFEFVTKVDSVKNLLSQGDAIWLDRLDTGNRIDFAFMIVYSLLLGGWLWIARREFNYRWLIVGVALSVIALIGDFLENLQLLKLTELYREGAGDEAFAASLAYLQVFTWLKWLSLALAFALCGTALILRRGRWRWVGLFLLLPLVLSPGALTLSPGNLQYFTLSISACFGLLVIHSFLYKKPESEVV